uniref:Uncharacterized protein n=1 Tax=Anguilla anguilla TaxID=7936 RepID=A0A0E9XDT3_ANGAN
MSSLRPSMPMSNVVLHKKTGSSTFNSSVSPGDLKCCSFYLL